MRKFLFVALLFCLGCESSCEPKIETQYLRETKGNKLQLTITHSNCRNGSIELRDLESTKKYKEQLQRTLKEVENFEKDLIIREGK